MLVRQWRKEGPGFDWICHVCGEVMEGSQPWCECEHRFCPECKNTPIIFKQPPGGAYCRTITRGPATGTSLSGASQ